MNTVGPDAVSYSKNLNFSFSNTLRNEKVNLNDYSSATFIIDVNGTIYQGSAANESSANIIIIGGINQFINEKVSRPVAYFYLTEQQKFTLYKIIRSSSISYNDAQISSDNETLNYSLSSLYANYIG